jgi:Ca2+-binding EF-hand superfamily protein
MSPILRLSTLTELSPTSPAQESTRPTHRRNHAISASVDVPLDSGYQTAETMLFTLLFTAFDEKGIGTLDFQEFVVHLALLARGNLQQKLALCFAAYDQNRDRRITAQDLQRVLDTPVLNGILVHDLTPLSDALVRKHIEDKPMELDVLEFALLVDELPRLIMLIDVQHLIEIKVAPPPVLKPVVPAAAKPGLMRRRSSLVSPERDTPVASPPGATTYHPQPPSGSPAGITSPRVSVRK